MRLFETKDKFGKKVYLTKERWTHILTEHPEVLPYLQEFSEIFLHPTKISQREYDPQIRYYYQYYKHRTQSAKYLLIIVNYLNGEGFIITAYFVRRIP